MLLKALNDSDSYTRTIAANAASHYPDEPVIQKLLQMYQKERDWQVRLSVIRSLGFITDKKEVLQILKKGLNQPDLTNEERLATLEALCQNVEINNIGEVKELVQSTDISMRFFACFFMMNFGLAEDAAILLPLIQDENLEIRIAAIFAISILGYHDEKLIHLLSEQIENQDPGVSMVASWALIPYQGKRAVKKLEEFLFTSSKPLNRMAAAVLAHAGPIAKSVCIRYLHEHKDAFVRLSLARALLHDTEIGEQAAHEIVRFLKNTRSRIMFSRHALPIFQHVNPSKVRFHPMQQQYPIFVDQMVRIELLNEVSMKYPKLCEEMLSQFFAFSIRRD